MKLSIIIPMYNAEKYIERCLDSIIKQLGEEDELIIVDDGSTDHSPQICDKYGKKYSNLKVIHQKNGGEGAARNMGVSAACGDYIMYVDADDFVDQYMIQCIKSTVHDSYDVILFEYIEEDGNIFEKKYQKENIQTHVYTRKDHNKFVQANFLNQDIVCNCNFNMRSVWAKMYRKEFLIKNHIKFDENVQIGEDMIYTLKVYETSNKILCVEYPVYHYYFRNINSITNRYKPDLEHIISSYEDKITPWLKKHKEYRKYHAYYRLNDIILYLKYDFYHKKNMENHNELNKRMKRILNTNNYMAYYKTAKESGLLDNYSLEKRIVFYLAVHNCFFLLKWITKMKYRV